MRQRTNLVLSLHSLLVLGTVVLFDTLVILNGFHEFGFHQFSLVARHLSQIS